MTQTASISFPLGCSLAIPLGWAVAAQSSVEFLATDEGAAWGPRSPPEVCKSTAGPQCKEDTPCPVPTQLLPSSFPATLLFIKQPSKQSTGGKQPSYLSRGCSQVARVIMSQRGLGVARGGITKQMGGPAGRETVIKLLIFLCVRSLLCWCRHSAWPYLIVWG